jgi:hypothetical protein
VRQDRQTVDVKFASAKGASIEVFFEPGNKSIGLSDGESVYLRAPLDVVGSIVVEVWQGGISVWVPFPDDYSVLDENRTEIDKL